MDNTGCIFQEKGIDFGTDDVCDCPITHNDGRGRPLLISDYHGSAIDWEKLFYIKEKRINEQKEKTICECKNCYHLDGYKFSGIKKISELNFSSSCLCNAKCVYCSSIHSDGGYNYDLYPIVCDLINKGYYEPGGEATFQGGEPTLMLNFEKLLSLLIEKGTNAKIHTNGIICTNAIIEALKNSKASVVISPDSGTAKTYKRIKQVDCFDKVCHSIEEYSKANNKNLLIKYLIVPGYNDNIKEIDMFFNLMRKLNVINVALEIEVQYARKYENKNLSKHIFLLVDYFLKTAASYNIKVIIYSFLSYVLKNKPNNIPNVISEHATKFFMILYKNVFKNIKYNR